jgi:site-specific DNA-methyltransferase (adenine-specific)
MKYENLQGVKLTSNVTLYNCDCMELLRQTPDKYYSLSIVDPPYGNSILKRNKHQKHNAKGTYRNEAIPNDDYYSELIRVSKNQIVWGFQYQYHKMPPGGSCIIWDKGAEPDLHNISACDIAWTSLKIRIERIYLHWCGAVKCETEETIHIHQKPIQLYRWLLRKFAVPEFKIIDTHLGSGSSAIAAYDFGCAEFVGCEIDKDYYDAAVKRLNIHKMQQKLW